ncbi:MAG: RHS repeat-associated core domain-containing protein, partial [Thermoplasmata archaeon]
KYLYVYRKTHKFSFDFPNEFGINGQNVNYELYEDGSKARYTHPIASGGCSGGCGGASNVFTDHPISMERDGQKYYYLYDGQGSVTELVTGSVVPGMELLVVENQYRYTPFGEPRVKIEAVENPYEYAGRRLDDESGKYYNRARIYSAEQGRFMSQDPMGNQAGANRYAYCGNNPTNNRDPSGMIHDWELAKIDGGGGGYSGGSSSSSGTTGGSGGSTSGGTVDLNIEKMAKQAASSEGGYQWYDWVLNFPADNTYSWWVFGWACIDWAMNYYHEKSAAWGHCFTGCALRQSGTSKITAHTICYSKEAVDMLAAVMHEVLKKGEKVFPSKKDADDCMKGWRKGNMGHEVERGWWKFTFTTTEIYSCEYICDKYYS